MAQDQVAPEVTVYRTAQQIAAGHLRSAILAGRLPPGTAISPEEVAEQLQISRMPVREALRELASEGLVELRRHRQALVVSLKAEDIAEIFGIRALLESRSVELAVPHFDDEGIQELRSLTAQMLASMRVGDAERWLTLNRDFHRTIDARCPWTRLRSLIEVQDNALAPYFRLWGSASAKSTLIDCMPVFHMEHRVILEAIERGDAAMAASSTSNHVLTSSRELLAVLSSLRAPTPE